MVASRRMPVFLRRGAISSDTGIPLAFPEPAMSSEMPSTIEWPKSPCATPASQSP